MDKEVIRNLCRYMATKHNIELDSIRIGSNQKTRLGSATVRSNVFTSDIKHLSVSISSYSTDSGNEYWDTTNKVAILDTIIHEFAHLEHFKRGWNPGHGDSWKETYHKLLHEDWKELVQMYNLLAVDTLSNSWELMIKYNNDIHFDADKLFKMLDTTDGISYTRVVLDIIDTDKHTWISALNELEKFGMIIELGDGKFIVKKDTVSVAELVKIGGKLEIVK